MPKPDLVTFDVYMALLDIEGSLVPVVEKTFAMTEESATAFVRMWRAKQMQRAAISNSLDKGRTSFRDATGMALDYVAGRHKVSIDADTRGKLIAAWDTLNPWPEADDVISRVKDKGCQTAILSNGDQDMLEAVARLFPTGFDHILSSETAGKYKPHPAVYDLPTSALGIEKEHVLHVAGSPNDVLGCIAAGMACVWSNRQGDTLLDPAYPPTKELPDLNGVPDLI
ncbi:MAG: haloacid dehalogenase type II [Hyphomicrobiaceae bacterium]|nr:haloacid dehalogenase type II [Hyphomicrobiaceae bacterium]